MPKEAWDQDYVFIAPSRYECSSLVGRQGQKQVLKLKKECYLRPALIVHELMHAVGFVHEQSRNDRDKYVVVHEENILGDKLDQFLKYNLSVVDHLNTT